MSTLSVAADIRQAQVWIKKLGGSTKIFTGKMLRAVGSKGVSAVKRGYKKTLKKRTGLLYKEIKSSLARDKMSVSVYSSARSSSSRYGFALAAGEKIMPKNSSVLVFKNESGELVFTRREVSIPARDWFTPEVERFARSVEFQATVQKVLDKEVARLNK